MRRALGVGRGGRGHLQWDLGLSCPRVWSGGEKRVSGRERTTRSAAEAQGDGNRPPRGSWAAETVAGRGEARPRIDVLGDRGASVLPTRSLRNCTETEGRMDDPTARTAER